MYFETRNIDVHYDQVHALKGVGIGLDQGEIVALIGSNGAGKTTTLKAITGLQAPSSGEIWFDGERIDRLSPSQIVVRGITMVPEGRRVFPYMSVKDNLLMGAFTRRDKGEIAAKLDHALTRFPRLKERWRQDAGTMSGGEQQMLVISRALMSSPRLLLLDEPSLGIAPKLVQDIARSIVSINRDDGIGVILVEQNSRMALKISHRAYALSLGQV
ncbi:MAG TPA: ABC transporter ATP-binding protein, partial [Aestuariivirgaceae bacterium]|nr:ABC transporter ATP-binding protein [Aestuariivirgaceae bacterium]